MTIEKPYGVWQSKLSAERLAEKSIRYGHMCVDGKNLYWLESRANEKGRGVIVKAGDDGSLKEILPKEISVRSKVHEYGSADFIISDGDVYFSNANDQCIYRFNDRLERITESATSISEQSKCLGLKEYRYADYVLSADKRCLICIRESHYKDKVVNELVSVDLSCSSSSKPVKVIATGNDFYISPRFSSDGKKLCWLSWNQPEMPWDAAELWVAKIDLTGSLSEMEKVAGGVDGDLKESIYQPSWGCDNTLHFISDISGWTNIYTIKENIKNALTPIDRDFGMPQWSLASSTYAIGKANRIFAVYIQNGEQFLCQIEQSTGKIEPIELPICDFGEHLLHANNKLYFKGASTTSAEQIYSYDLESRELFLLNEEKSFLLSIRNISVGKAISFDAGSENVKRVSHAFYYEPKNADYVSPENSKPPLIVMSHGGPTGMTIHSLNAAIQFWTNRGFAVVDVNYSGSTGFGKRYKDRLIGNWGVIDVEDCIAAAEYLVKQGLADKDALLIRGGSAGGYTTLCALTFHNTFKAGMSRYGIADLESLATDSHKFEARYLDICIGEYPKQKNKYIERSPIHFTEQLSCPILILQGEEDKVVPPNQAEMMANALEKKKLPYAYQLYKGEGHGFRKSETIIHSLKAELSFYRQVLNIATKEDRQMLKVKNLLCQHFLT